MYLNIIGSLILFVWCYYQKDKGAPPLSYVVNYKRYERLIPELKKEETEEEKQWSDILYSYGYSHTDDLDHQIARFVEKGYYDVILAEQVEIKNKEAHKQQGQNSFKKVWDLYHDSFDDNEEEFLNELVTSFRQNMSCLSLYDLQSTVKMVRAFDKEELANTLVDEFLTYHKGDISEKITSREVFREDIKDDYLIRQLNKILAAAKDKRTLAEIVKKLASSNGWNPEDIDLLAKCEVEDYYNFFKSEKSDRLYTYVKTCLKFKGFSSGEDQYSLIASKAKDALLKIAQECRINQMRVSTMYEIKLDTDS